MFKEPLFFFFTFLVSVNAFLKWMKGMRQAFHENTHIYINQTFKNSHENIYIYRLQRIQSNESAVSLSTKAFYIYNV